MEALVKFFERKLHVAVDKHHKALKGEICKLCNEVANLYFMKFQVMMMSKLHSTEN